MQDASKNDITENGAWLLARGIRSLLRCDEAEVVRGIARYVISKYPSLRIGSAFMERNRHRRIPPVAAFLGAVTRFLEVRLAASFDGVVWVARLDNERRVIEKLPALVPELNWTELPFGRPPERAALSALPRVLFPLRRRILRLARLMLRRKDEFFKVLRAIELIGYYARYLDIFQKGNFSLAVVSSHSNPHGIAFNLAARRCGIPVALVTHGMPVRPVAKLSYDLAVVHCEAARRTYLEEGCRMKRVIIHGRRQDYIPMPAKLPVELTVGIFLCKDVNEERLDALIKTLLSNRRVSRVIIRPHPKNLFLELDAWIESLKDTRVGRTSGDSVFRDLEMSDIVLGGNSSVLIEAVTAGRTAGYVCGLDHGSTDLHKLVAGGLVYPFDEFNFDPDAMLGFYQRAEWLSVLRLFANIDEDESAVDERIKNALREIARRKDEKILNAETF